MIVNENGNEFKAWPPSEETIRCPFAYFDEARRRAPILKFSDRNAFGRSMYLVTGHAECSEILLRHAEFTSDLSDVMPGFDKSAVPFPFPDEPAFHEIPVVFFSDGEDHKVKRKWSMPLVKRSRVDSFRPGIERQVRKIIGTFSDRGTCDFRKEFSDILPIHVLQEILDLPEEAFAIIKRLSQAIAETDVNPEASPEKLREKDAAFKALFQMNRALIESRFHNPGADYISELVKLQCEQDGALDVNSLSIHLQGILFGGDHAVGAHLAHLVVALCENRELQDELRTNSGKIAAFVKETLRLEAPVPWLFRKCAIDAKVGQFTIEAGAVVMVATAAANRDPSRFVEPSEFSPDRSNLGADLLSFGKGVHRCIGEPLAYVIAETMIRVMLETMANISLDQEASDVAPAHSFQFRCPEKVVLNFESV